MTKASIFKKSLSLVLALVLCLGLVQPAFAATTVSESDGPYYVALGDGMTDRVGLGEEEKSYVDLVAEHLGVEEDSWSYGNKRWRIEELRYLLNLEYDGDGYTKTVNAITADRKGDIREDVAGAEVITINIGTNNFSTYIIEQMMYYLENGGAVKYEYSFDEFADADLQDAMENVQGIVMDQLKTAAGETGADALELIDFVVEVSTYTLISYITSFNDVVDTIYKLNPDVDLYVVGLYNPAEGEVLSIDYHGTYKEIAIGEVFGSLVELANAYIQVLCHRVHDYTYVDAGSPELLIDQMGNTKLGNVQDRVPAALTTVLFEAAEETGVSMIQEMFATYGVEKSYKEACNLLYDILACETAEEREEFVVSLLHDMVVDEVLVRFETELENYASTYGSIDITRDDIIALLTDLDNAADIAVREEVAEEFVVDLMTKAMVGQTFAGMYIETQEDAYEAIDLLEKNSSGDPAALREAAANMIWEKVAGSALEAFISKQDVVDLLEQLDTTTTTAERESIIDAWMTDLAAEKITEKIQSVNPDYTEENARDLLAAMNGKSEAEASEIAKQHMLTTGGFHDYMVQQFEATYEENGLALQTYADFDAFVGAVESAETDDEAKAIVRNEIRAAGAQKVVESTEFKELMGDGMTADQVDALFNELDAAADKDSYMYNWLCKYYELDNPTEPQDKLILIPMKTAFLNGYNSYNKAATAAEEAFVTYRNGVQEASDAFAQYNALKDQAAAKILEAYEQSYKGAGETALGYYADYLSLKAAAVAKVMDGYDQYMAALEKGMESCDALNDKFDTVYSLMCEIAEVEIVSLNDLMSVANKITSNGNYVSEMVSNLMQGDSLASDDKTVAYIALRYYLAGSMMIMPSASGHEAIADNIIYAIENGKSVYTTEGYWANRVVDGLMDIYNCITGRASLDTSASGQVGTLINPEVYVALGGNITTGDSYVQLLADALAMADDRFDDDIVHNLAIDGLRAEDLLVLVSDSYAGDAYTAGRFGEGELEALRAEYQQYISEADLITIEIGINNLVTFPMTQTLLAYNGNDAYEMNWGQYIGTNRAATLEKGKDAMHALLLGLANNDAQCEKALNTVSTAVESMLYSLLGYIFHLDDAVESIAELNEDATIAMIGFYNPMNGTYIQIDKEVTVAGKTVDLSEYSVNVSAIVDKLVDVANRFLANYVGNTEENCNANDAGSRLLNVEINDTSMKVDDMGISKDLSSLVDYREITVAGKTVMLQIPKYFLRAGQTRGEAMLPSVEGYQDICDAILEALDFAIYADVYAEPNTKIYGDADPELIWVMDDESSLYGLEVQITREAGENVGLYDIFVEVLNNTGYYEVDTYNDEFEIIARPITVDVTIMGDEIVNVTLNEGTLASWDANADLVNLLGLYVDGEDVYYTNANYDVEVVVYSEREPVYVCMNTTTGKLYEIVHLAVLEANAGDTIEMIADSDQTVLTDIYHYAGEVNMVNGVTLDLKGYTLKLNALFAAEGNYVTADYEKSAGVGGRLVIDKADLIIREAFIDGSFTVLPFWMEDEGCYVFGRFGLFDAPSANVGYGLNVDVDNDVITFFFKHRAEGYLNSVIAGGNVANSGLSIEVYLQWDTPTGVSYQHFVFNNEDIQTVAGSDSAYYYYTLPGFSRLNIDLDSLRVNVNILSDSGAALVGQTYDANGMIVSTSEEEDSQSGELTWSDTIDQTVCVNTTTGVEYFLVHDAVSEAEAGDTIRMIANSDQTALTDLCPSAGMVNLKEGVTLDLDCYILKLDVLVVPEGSYVTASYEKAANVGGRLIIEKDNLVIADGTKDSAFTVLPYWMADEGCYVFGRFGLFDTPTGNVNYGLDVNVDNDVITFYFKHRAEGYLNSCIASGDIANSGLSVEVYLQWNTPTGVSYQHFVFNDEDVQTVAGSDSAYYYYTLPGFSQLSIDLDSLVVSVRIVSDSGVACEGNSHTVENNS